MNWENKINLLYDFEVALAPGVTVSPDPVEYPLPPGKWVPSSLSGLFHDYPHVDYGLQTVSNTFNPLSSDYMASVHTSGILMFLILVLILCVFFIIFLCVISHKTPTFIFDNTNILRILIWASAGLIGFVLLLEFVLHLIIMSKLSDRGMLQPPYSYDYRDYPTYESVYARKINALWNEFNIFFYHRDFSNTRCEAPINNALKKMAAMAELNPMRYSVIARVVRNPFSAALRKKRNYVALMAVLWIISIIVIMLLVLLLEKTKKLMVALVATIIWLFIMVGIVLSEAVALGDACQNPDAIVKLVNTALPSYNETVDGPEPGCVVWVKDMNSQIEKFLMVDFWKATSCAIDYLAWQYDTQERDRIFRDQKNNIISNENYSCPNPTYITSVERYDTVGSLRSLCVGDLPLGLMLAQIIAVLVAAILLTVVFLNLLKAHTAGWSRHNKKLNKLPPKRRASKRMTRQRQRQDYNNRNKMAKLHVGRSLSEHSSPYLIASCCKRRIPAGVITFNSETSLDGCEKKIVDDEEMSDPEYCQGSHKRKDRRRRRRRSKDGLESKDSSEFTVPFYLIPKDSPCEFTSSEDYSLSSMPRYAKSHKPQGYPPMAYRANRNSLRPEYPSMYSRYRYRNKDFRTFGSLNRQLDSDGSRTLSSDCDSIISSEWPNYYQARYYPYSEDPQNYLDDRISMFVPNDSSNSYNIQAYPPRNEYASFHYNSRPTSGSRYDSELQEYPGRYCIPYTRESYYMTPCDDSRNNFDMDVRDLIQPAYSPDTRDGEGTPPTHDNVIFVLPHEAGNGNVCFDQEPSSAYSQTLPYNIQNVSVDHKYILSKNKVLPTTRANLNRNCSHGSSTLKQTQPYHSKSLITVSHLNKRLNLKRIEARTALEQNRLVVIQSNALSDTTHLEPSIYREPKRHSHCKSIKTNPSARANLSSFMFNNTPECQLPTASSTDNERSQLSNNFVTSSIKQIMDAQNSTSPQKDLPEIGLHFSTSTSSPRFTPALEYLKPTKNYNNIVSRSKPSTSDVVKCLFAKDLRKRRSTRFSLNLTSKRSADLSTPSTRLPTEVSCSREQSTRNMDEKRVLIGKLKSPDSNTRSKEHAVDDIREDESDENLQFDETQTQKIPGHNEN